MYKIKLTDLNKPLKPMDFVRLFVEPAKNQTLKTGLSYYALITQMAYESGWNKQSSHFNFTGLKWDKRITPMFYTVDTFEELTTAGLKVINGCSVKGCTPFDFNGKKYYRYLISDKFCAFSDMQSFLDGYCKFIQLNFPTAWAFRDNPQLYFWELSKNSYATAPNYYKEMIATLTWFKKNI